MLKFHKYIQFTEQELMYIRFALIEAKQYNKKAHEKFNSSYTGDCRLGTLINDETIKYLDDKILKHFDLNR